MPIDKNICSCYFISKYMEVYKMDNENKNNNETNSQASQEETNKIIIKSYEEKLTKITEEFTKKLAEKDQIIKEIISGSQQQQVNKNTIYDNVVAKVNKLRGVK